MGEFLVVIGVWVLFLAVFFLFFRGSALGRKKGDLLWQEEIQEGQLDDRRRYKRRYLPLPVKYASLEQADLQETTLTYDVGKGGVRLPATYSLRQGSRLYLFLNLPPKNSPLSLFGEVVWQKSRPGSPSRFDTGVKFVDLSTSNIMRIARYL